MVDEIALQIEVQKVNVKPRCCERNRVPTTDFHCLDICHARHTEKANFCTSKKFACDSYMKYNQCSAMMLLY